MVRNMPERLDHIAAMVNSLAANNDPAAVTSIKELLSEVADEENERTFLLQQRASSLLASATLVVTIILASIGLMLKDAQAYLKGCAVRTFSHMLYGILLIFGASLYWTWKGFGTRSFVSFDMEGLLTNMGQSGADFYTAQIVAIQQTFQMVIVNSSLNTEKGAALRWATGNLFLGLLFFAVSCLFLLIQINRSVPDKGESNGN